jgi:hypothetical protein
VRLTITANGYVSSTVETAPPANALYVAEDRGTLPRTLYIFAVAPGRTSEGAERRRRFAERTRHDTNLCRAELHTAVYDVPNGTVHLRHITALTAKRGFETAPPTHRTHNAGLAQFVLLWGRIYPSTCLHLLLQQAQQSVFW